jgi:hypothetical protein
MLPDFMMDTMAPAGGKLYITKDAGIFVLRKKREQN